MEKRIEEIKNRTKENLLEYLKKIWEIIKKPEMEILPGQLAFFMLLSLVPIITLCGYGAGMFNINMSTFVQFIEDFVPSGSSLAPYITGNTIDFKLAIMFIWMFYLASNGLNTVILISNQIYGITQSNWIKRRIKSIFMTFTIVLAIIFLLAVPVFGNKIIEVAKFFNIGETIHNALRLLKGPFMWIFMFIFIRATYEFAPDRVRKNSHLNTGTIFTLIGWVIITQIYSVFTENMTTYNIFYGALSNIAVLMLWLYFMSYVFVIGLCLNYGEELDHNEIKHEKKDN